MTGDNDQLSHVGESGEANMVDMDVPVTIQSSAKYFFKYIYLTNSNYELQIH